VIGMARGAAIAPVAVQGGTLAADIAIGRYTFPHPWVTVRPLPPGFPEEPIVGTQVLSAFVLSLDQRTARLRLARSGPDEIPIVRAASRPR